MKRIELRILWVLTVCLFATGDLCGQVIGVSVKGGLTNVLRGAANDSPERSTYWGVDFSYDLESVRLKHYLLTTGVNTWNYSSSAGVAEAIEINYLQVPLTLQFHKGLSLTSRTLHSLAGVGVAFDFPYDATYIENGVETDVPPGLDKLLFSATAGAEVMYFLSSHLALCGELTGYVSLSKVDALDTGNNRYIIIRTGLKLSYFFNGN